MESLVTPERHANDRSATRQFPRFLELAPELRNRIYRFVLVSPRDIHLEREARVEPALLRTTRQLRDEAASIYYSENLFVMKIHDMAGAEVVPFRHLLLRYRTSVRGNFRVQLLTGVDWSNLLEWLKTYHGPQSSMKCYRPSSKGTYNSDGRIVAYAFDVVKRMKDDRWSKVEEVLEAFHMTVAVTRPDWK